MEYLELLFVRPQIFPALISNTEGLPTETKLISIPLSQILGEQPTNSSGWKLERAGIIKKTDNGTPITNINYKY